MAERTWHYYIISEEPKDSRPLYATLEEARIAAQEAAKETGRAAEVWRFSAEQTGEYVETASPPPAAV